MGHFRPLFSLVLSFQQSRQKTNVQFKFADDWIRIAGLWFRMQPRYQLNHNHFRLLN